MGRYPWRRVHPVSRTIWALTWAATIILLLGILLVAAKANQGNAVVHAIMSTGRWLATPLHDVFNNPNPDHSLYENWGLAAAVYFIVGRTLAWLIRF